MRRMRTGVAQAILRGATVCAVAITLGGAAGAEPFARPRFDWIEPGARRPIPHVAETTAACWETPSDACLRRAWLARLRQYHERELAAPGTSSRSYRVIWDRSFFAPVSIRLDVAPSGVGRLTTRWLQRRRAIKRGKSLVRLPEGFSSRQPPVRAVGRDEVVAFEAALKAHGFETIEADPEPEVVCSDGSSFVIEAVVSGRYRYVSRDCSIGEHAVSQMGLALIHLAERRQPDQRFNPEE